MHAPPREGAREGVRITPTGIDSTPPPGTPRRVTTYSPAPGGGRPIGVTLLTIVFTIFAVFGSLAAVAIFVESASIAASEPGFGVITVAIGVVVAVIALASGAVASGLYRGARWAWFGALALATMSMLVNVANIIAGELAISALGLLVAALIVWNLTRADSRAWLGISERAPRGRGRPV